MSQLTPNFFALILQMEGGYQNHPADNGNYACGQLAGTNMGISAIAYYDYTKRCPTERIMRALNRDFAFKFYQWYWRRWRIHEIEYQQVAELLMNNFMGAPKYAAIATQRALNRLGFSLAEDGAMGSKTIAAVNYAVRQNVPLVYNTIREQWIAHLNTTKPEFRQGLLNRVNAHFAPLVIGDATQPSSIHTAGAGLYGGTVYHIFLGAGTGNLTDLFTVLLLAVSLGIGGMLVYRAFKLRLRKNHA